MKVFGRERLSFYGRGYVTKLGEHIPGLADTICCIHKFRGLDAEAERARAFSLHRILMLL